MPATHTPGQRALRRGRISILGGAYVLTTVTDGRCPLLSHLFAARAVVNTIADLDDERVAETLAFVVMPDHVHWLMRLRGVTLPEVMRRFKGRSSRRLGLLSRSGGRTWQPGYYDHALRMEDDLRIAARYIVANPVRRGLADTIYGYPHWWCAWEVEDDG